MYIKSCFYVLTIKVTIIHSPRNPSHRGVMMEESTIRIHHCSVHGTCTSVEILHPVCYFNYSRILFTISSSMYPQLFPVEWPSCRITLQKVLQLRGFLQEPHYCKRLPLTAPQGTQWISRNPEWASVLTGLWTYEQHANFMVMTSCVQPAALSLSLPRQWDITPWR